MGTWAALWFWCKFNLVPQEQSHEQKVVDAIDEESNNKCVQKVVIRRRPSPAYLYGMVWTMLRRIILELDWSKIRQLLYYTDKFQTIDTCSVTTGARTSNISMYALKKSVVAINL